MYCIEHNIGLQKHFHPSQNNFLDLTKLKENGLLTEEEKQILETSNCNDMYYEFPLQYISFTNFSDQS